MASIGTEVRDRFLRPVPHPNRSDGLHPVSARDQAQIEKELLDLYTKYGRLDPKEVVDAARSPKSALHDRFEWDDTTAAEAYRLQQARGLIRSVYIERVIAPEEPPRRIRYWTHDPVSDGYLRTDDVAKLPDIRDKVLENMRKDLERLRDKWSLYDATFRKIAAEVLEIENDEDDEDESGTVAP